MYSKIISKFTIHTILRPRISATIHRLNNPGKLTFMENLLQRTHNYNNDNLDLVIKTVIHSYSIKCNNFNTNAKQSSSHPISHTLQYKKILILFSVILLKPSFIVMFNTNMKTFNFTA